MSNYSLAQQQQLAKTATAAQEQKAKLLAENKQAANRHLLSIKLLLAQKPLCR
jgi:hypothetical protein